MKKISSVILASSLFLSTFAYCTEDVSAADSINPPASSGDINSDGKVNVADFCLLKSVINGDTSDSGISGRSDINSDGKTDSADILLLTEYLQGISDKLPDKPAVPKTYELLRSAVCMSITCTENGETVPTRKYPIL